MKYANARKGQLVRFHREGSTFDGCLGFVVGIRGGQIDVGGGDWPRPYGCDPSNLTILLGREKAIALAAMAFNLTPELQTSTQSGD